MNKQENIYSTYMCCPVDQGKLEFKKTHLLCQTCKQKYPIKDGVVQVLPNITPDIELSIKKWDLLYENQIKNKSYLKNFKEYKEKYYDIVYPQLNREKKIKDIVYLEIGSGPASFAALIAAQCKVIICIDFCPHALLIAKKILKKNNINNYLLIQGDILDLPIKNSVVDLIFGSGVIEHFQDTQRSVDELYRVLKKNGVSVNTVPHLNIGSLTYRQVWGNIPNFPVLKQLAEFIHIKLLGGKHMIFGYEFSFLGSTMKNIHKKAGFKKIKVERLEVPTVFEFLPAFVRKPMQWLAEKSPLFWPMIKVIATK